MKAGCLQKPVGSRGSMGSLGQKDKLYEGFECKGGIKSNKSKVGLGQVSVRQEQFGNVN